VKETRHCQSPAVPRLAARILSQGTASAGPSALRLRRSFALTFAALGVLGIAATAYAVFVERSHVQLAEYALGILKPGLSPGGLTILHISDLHLRADGRVQSWKLAALRTLLHKVRYDLALITGDLIHDEPGFPVALALLDELHPALGAFSVPGNHDYCQYTVLGNEGAPRGGCLPARCLGAARSFWRLAGKVLRNDLLRQPLVFHDVTAMNTALKSHGIRPLVNRAVHLEIKGADLWIAGVDDLVEGTPNLQAALASVPADALLVLLAHNPDAWLDPLAGRADLVLSGHTHGGQIRLPLLGAAHTQGTHLARSGASGWFRQGHTRLFVSRGVGESLPLRLGAAPQIALIHLIPVPPAER
jgi:uncharacterized protein